MYNQTYLQAILIYVRDKQTGYIHIVGTDQHDRLYLDDNGNIQYMNLQNGGTTEEGYEFVLDEQGHNQNNLTYTEEEQEKYGLSNMDDYFNSIDLETYMDLESKKRIQELTEINMRLVTEKQDCSKDRITWLLSQRKKPKYKFTQFEYDLINTYRHVDDRCKFNGCYQLRSLKEKGYFNDVDKNELIKDILENCEVVEDRKEEKK